MDRRRSIRYPLALRTQLSLVTPSRTLHFLGYSENVSRTGLLARCATQDGDPLPTAGTIVTADLEMLAKNNSTARSLCCEGVVIWVRPAADSQTFLFGIRVHHMYFRELPAPLLLKREPSTTFLQGTIQ